MLAANTRLCVHMGSGTHPARIYDACQRLQCYAPPRCPLDLWFAVGYADVTEMMRPEDALLEQIRRYQQMTGEQRLALALELHELSCNVAREGIRHQHPEADEAEVERKLHQRLRLASQ